MSGGILALDLGINTGWGAISTDGAFGTGVLHLPPKRGQTNGPRFMAFRNFLIENLRAYRVKTVAYEQVLTRHRGGAQAALANGFVAILEEVCQDHNLELMVIHGATLKVWGAGHGKAEKSDMYAAASARWPGDEHRWTLVDRVPSHDQVDAVWVLNWAIHALGFQLTNPPEELATWPGYPGYVAPPVVDDPTPFADDDPKPSFAVKFTIKPGGKKRKKKKRKPKRPLQRGVVEVEVPASARPGFSQLHFW